MLKYSIPLYKFVYSFKVVKLVFKHPAIEFASVVWWSEFLATDTEVPASIPRHYKERKK
jgi:hypothetical protein